MFVEPDLTAPCPKGFIDNDFMGLSRLWNHEMGGSQHRTFRIRAPRKSEHGLCLVDFTISILGSNCRVGPRGTWQCNETVTHSVSLQLLFSKRNDNRRLASPRRACWAGQCCG